MAERSDLIPRDVDAIQAEALGEGGLHRREDFLDGDGASEQASKAGDAIVADTAGDDDIEVGEIGADVEGKAVLGDPAAGLDADGRELFRMRGAHAEHG